MNTLQLPVKELRPALAGFSKVLTKRSTLRVLQCIRVRRDPNGSIELSVSDLDRSATCALDTRDAGKSLSVLVPFEDLNNVVKSSGPDDLVHIDQIDETTASIRFLLGGQTVEHPVGTPPVEEFPEDLRIEGTKVPLPPVLRESIHQAMECSSDDVTRAILQGACLDASSPGAHYVVGTDGRHLFSSNSFTLPLSGTLVIPGHKFLGWRGFNQDGDWHLRHVPATDKRAAVCELSSDHWRFVTRCIKGTYPQWRQVVPSTDAFQTRIAIPAEKREAFATSVFRLPIHEEKHHTIAIEVSEGKFFLLGKSRPEASWTRVPVPDALCSGPDVMVQLDKRYLQKALRFGLGLISLIDPRSPVKFSEAGRSLIVMPIRPSGPSVTPTPPVPEVAPANSTTPTQPPEEVASPPTPKHMQDIKHPPTAPLNGGTSPSPGNPVKEDPKSALETALVQIETIRSSFREVINSLTKLGDSIRQAMREQKASEKEVQNVRQTLRSLQGMRI